MKRAILLAVVFGFSTLVSAQVAYVALPSQTVISLPAFGPVVVTPMAELPSPATGGMVLSTGQAEPGPGLSLGGYGWSGWPVGASNATWGNVAGATNATIGFRAVPMGYEASARRLTGMLPFNSGAALYSDVSSAGDVRSLGKVAAQLRTQPRPAARTYTNSDIQRLHDQQPARR